MRLKSPLGSIAINIGMREGLPLSTLHSRFTNIQLVRAGELIYGSGEVETFMGWIAPTYANKEPALSLTVTATGTPPLTFTTEWQLPTGNGHTI
jgi:hypothetical protein